MNVYTLGFDPQTQKVGTTNYTSQYLILGVIGLNCCLLGRLFPVISVVIVMLTVSLYRQGCLGLDSSFVTKTREYNDDECSVYNPFTLKSTKKNSRKIPNLISLNIEKQMLPCKNTAEEVLFEWSHYSIQSSTDSKVRATLHVSIIYSGSAVARRNRLRL